jgi:hypothetical protein
MKQVECYRVYYKIITHHLIITKQCHKHIKQQNSNNINHLIHIDK